METTPSTGQLMAENEELRQELLNIKSKLDKCEKTTAHLSDELEQLQERSTKKIDEIRTQYESQQKSHGATIEHLKAAIAEQSNITQQSSSDIPATKTSIMTLDNTSSQQKLERAIKESKYSELIVIIKQNMASIEKSYAKTQLTISEFSKDVKSAEAQIESLEHNLLIKAKEIIELNKLLFAAQEQNSMLAAKLGEIRSNPDKKGSSLEAVVADECIILIETIREMEVDYFCLKIQHDNCPRQIRELRNMHEQTERLYEQFMREIECAGYFCQLILNEQNYIMNEQIDTANSRIRYLENLLANKSADWVNKLFVYNREYTQLMEAHLQICNFRQQELLEKNESVLSLSWTWQVEVHRMKLKASNIQMPYEIPTFNDAEATTSGFRASDMKNHETKEEDSASSKVNDRANHEKNSKDKDEDNRTQHAPYPLVWIHNYPSDVAACDTNRINIEATVSPTYSGELQESKKEQQQLLPEVTKKSIKAIDAVAMNTGRKTSLANKPKQKAKND